LGAGLRPASKLQRTTMDWPTNSEETKLIRHYHFSQQMNNIIIYFALLWKQEQVKLSLGVVLYYLVAFGGKKQSKGGQNCYIIAFVVCKDQECWQHFSRIELSQQANNKQAQASKDLKTKAIALYITTAKKCVIWVPKQSMQPMWRCSVCAIHSLQFESWQLLLSASPANWLCLIEAECSFLKYVNDTTCYGTITILETHWAKRGCCITQHEPQLPDHIHCHHYNSKVDNCFFLQVQPIGCVW
jgi:hypothetical protein